MATITTDTFLDDGTARTAGEVWTLNGGSLIVRTDTRWHVGKPAGMTGSIGTITGSASLGGGVLVDGRNVREITFNSGSGVVPAIGTSITQGGVSGYLLGVWPDLVSAPLTVGAAMPATGYLKFREVTGGSFSAGALTGISASSDGADVTSWIEWVQRQAVANTVNKLNFFRTRGDWYFLPQVTSGSVGQVIQVPTNGGGIGTEVPAIWIETGVGTNVYKKFKGLTNVYFNTTNIGTDERSRFVQCIGNGQVRIGSDGVNNIGFLPPAGCRIKIPNVLGRQTTAANDALNLIPNATLATRPDYTTTSSGIIDFEYFLSDSYFLFSSPGKVIIKFCATFDVYNTSNENQPCELEDFSVSPYNTASIALTLANNPLGGTFKEVEFWRSTAASNGHAGSITLCSNLDVEEIHCGVIQYARSSGRSINFSQVSDSVFKDFYQYNAAVATATCSRVKFIDMDHNDRIVGSTNVTSGINMLVTSVSCDAVTVEGFTFGQKGVVTDFCNPYLAIISNGASGNTLIRNGGTITNKLRVASALLAPQYIVQDSGVTGSLRAQRIYLDFTRTGDFIGQNTSKNIILENCQGTAGSSNIASNSSTLKGVRRSSQATTGAPAVVGTHFMDFFSSDTLGGVTFIANEPTAQTAPFVSTTLTTSAGGFNAAGQFIMPAIGDQIIIESPYTILGHTGFRNAAISISASNANNMTYEYDLDTGSGFSGTWTVTTSLSPYPQFSEVISETGFKIRLRVTTAVANPLNAIAYVTFLTTSTFNAQRDNLYPLDLININLSGLIPNSRVQLYNEDTNTELFNQIVTGTTLNLESEYIVDFNLRTRVTYTTDTTATIFYEDSELVTVSGVNKIINQETDDVYVANGIDGFLVPDIDIVDSTMLIEVDAPTKSWPEIYAYTVAWNYTEEGIRDEGVFMEALDQANYIVNGFQIKNVSSPSNPLTLTNGWGRDGVTNTTVAIIDNSGGSIFSNPDIVIPFSSGSGLSPTQDAILTQIGSRTERVDGMLEDTGTYDRFLATALEEAPAGGGGGSSDWTSLEKEQIRNRLGIDGAQSAPETANPTLASESDISTSQTAIIAQIDANEVKIDGIKAKTDTLVNTDLTPVLTAISNLNDLSAAEVLTQMTNALNTYDSPTKAELDTAVTTLLLAIGSGGVTASEIYDYFAFGTRPNIFKADLTSVLSAIALTSTSAEITAQTTTLLSAIGSGGATPAEIYNYFIALTRADAFKADISSLATTAQLEAAKNEILSATVAIDIPAIVAAVRADLERLGGPLALVKIDTTQIISNIANLNDISATDVYDEVLRGIVDTNLVDEADLLSLQTIILTAINNKVLIKNMEVFGQVVNTGQIKYQVESSPVIKGVVNKNELVIKII